MSARGSFSQKIVNYVARSRENGTVVAIIELDDRTHESARDERSASLANVLVRLCHPNVAIYTAGLMEWCADRSLPLEVGA